MTNNNKGQGLPIGTLVLIALAVFVLFLIIGFVTSGWSFFSGKFGLIKEGTSAEDVAINKCQTWCASWESAGQPTSGTYYDRLCNIHNDLDLNGDGTIDNADEYSCRGDTNSLLAASQCPVDCS